MKVILKEILKEIQKDVRVIGLNRKEIIIGAEFS